MHIELDVINTAGHRLSTAEIESALIAHPRCSEAAVVGIHDDITGYSSIHPGKQFFAFAQ
jgi:acetyl-CoA synthetase